MAIPRGTMVAVHTDGPLKKTAIGSTNSGKEKVSLVSSSRQSRNRIAHDLTVSQGRTISYSVLGDVVPEFP
jgi:hypothetical protein